MRKPATVNLSVDISSIREMSALNPLRSAVTLFFDWAVIAGAIAISAWLSHPAIYLIAILLVGNRMYALYSLLHDGIHYLLFPNRKANDWVCRLFLAGPLFLSFPKVRKFHLAHHQHLKTAADPEAVHLKYNEFQFPKPASELWFTFLKDTLGINFIWYKGFQLARWLLYSIKGENKPVTGDDTSLELFMVFYYLVILLFLLYMGWVIPFILYWIIPYITIYQALNRLRLSTEHFHLPADKVFQTRTVQLNAGEQFIFSPHNLGFHTEHHLYPSVPFYRLPDLHRLLMDIPDFRVYALVSKSYVQVIKEYIK